LISRTWKSSRSPAVTAARRGGSTSPPISKRCCAQAFAGAWGAKKPVVVEVVIERVVPPMVFGVETAARA
jgi:hypothetical protein